MIRDQEIKLEGEDRKNGEEKEGEKEVKGRLIKHEYMECGQNDELEKKEKQNDEKEGK